MPPFSARVLRTILLGGKIAEILRGENRKLSDHKVYISASNSPETLHMLKEIQTR